MTGPTKITPPVYARRLGVSQTKVLRWIMAGELPAMNAATRVGGKPRYLIDEADIVDFEQRRQAAAVSRQLSQRPRKSVGVPQYV